MTVSFEVIVMALAPRKQIDIFINYYKNLGAHRIRVFFDGNLSEDFDNGCENLIECNSEFWKSRQLMRPSGVEERQRSIYNYAYLSCDSDWVLIVDIDEFVFGEKNLNDTLKKINKSFDLLRFIPVEVIYRDGDNLAEEYGGRLLRKHYNKYLAAVLPHLLYPGLGHLFIRGLLGHSRGKQMVRAGIPNIEVNIHDSKCINRELRELNISTGKKCDRFYLAHFDAISFTHWREKWKRRLSAMDTNEMGLKRERQLAIWAKAFEEKKDERLFAKFYSFNSLQLAAARLFGLVIDNPLHLNCNTAYSNKKDKIKKNLT